MTGLRILTTAVLAACTSALCAPGTGSAQPPAEPGCPVLWVLGVQGTGESSPAASETADTGMLGAILGPVVAAVPNLVQRTYIPYSAAFGGAVGTGGGTAPYTASVGEGLAALTATADRVASDCPATALAVVGFSQGAQVVSEFARAVGASEGPLPPERVAGVALYSDPDRAPGSPVIPGRPGQLTPDPAPGTSGAAVSGVAITTAPAAGGGIATSSGVDYGALTGRVADVCVEGDLSCAAPERAALLRMAAQLAAQADLRDPLAALGSIQALLSGALGDAWTTVVNNDFRIGPGIVDYAPAASLAERLTDASDPRTPPPGPDETAAASARWGQITAIVASDPVGQLPKLAGQLSSAWGQLMADNADLTNPGVWLRYADINGRHTGYAATGHLASGIAWLTALAYDLAGS
ncbi:cutinase family protein [Nocardia amikacinitolerans]|uniref:cutinase family protein n=1 Tax=Nocardia amikacinitolerans TaxID=756689 RepID=UPI0020A58161|nr:cutinase family protein [Nocardia amikacinitolerans]MCP2290815.1 Cutinase [Nocardia amikacinitolerans]